MIYKILLGVTVVLLIVVAFFGNSYRRERDLYKDKIEHDFREKYEKLEQQLKASQQQRLILIDSFNNRNIYIESLLRINEEKDKELKAVKGRYNNLTSVEKANELTRRANGNTK